MQETVQGWGWLSGHEVVLKADGGQGRLWGAGSAGHVGTTALHMGYKATLVF